MGRIVLRVKRLALVLLLAAGCASASVGSQVKDACPESRDLYCGSAGHRCTGDDVRGCKVCVCGAQQAPAGGVPQPRPLSNPPSSAVAARGAAHAPTSRSGACDFGFGNSIR